MRLPSLFRRAPSGRAADRDAAEPSFSRTGASQSSAIPSPSSDETIATLRTRARRRLIGATVLVAVAVVTLPWLFESQPRALPADLPIEMARKDGPVTAPDLHRIDRPAPSSPMPVDGDPPPAAMAHAPSAADSVVAPTHEEPAPTHVSPRPPHPETTPGPPPVSPSGADPDAARALALLEGKRATTSAASAPAGLRYIVQIGAFAETDAVTSARGKAERLGLKTYTQIIDAPAGKRTRVRVGPYASKAEAEHAVSQLRTAGLAAVVLTL